MNVHGEKHFRAVPGMREVLAHRAGARCWVKTATEEKNVRPCKMTTQQFCSLFTRQTLAVKASNKNWKNAKFLITHAWGGRGRRLSFLSALFILLLLFFLNDKILTFVCSFQVAGMLVFFTVLKFFQGEHMT